MAALPQQCRRRRYLCRNVNDARTEFKWLAHRPFVQIYTLHRKSVSMPSTEHIRQALPSISSMVPSQNMGSGRPKAMSRIKYLYPIHSCIIRSVYTIATNIRRSIESRIAAALNTGVSDGTCSEHRNCLLSLELLVLWPKPG
jgi:hypothetical protein